MFSKYEVAMKNNFKFALVLLSTLIVLSMVFAPVQAGAPIAVTGLSTVAVNNNTVQYSVRNVNSSNDSASTVKKISVDGLFDLSVVQQPSGNAGYVSTKKDTLTQFGMASSYGSIGILAHNNLAGKYFPNISGKTITVTFSDGSTKKYTVSSVMKFQALEPTNQYSKFVDLNSSETLSSTDLFMKTFGLSGALVFQTCIAKDGSASWGRMFVIAYAS